MFPGLPGNTPRTTDSAAVSTSSFRVCPECAGPLVHASGCISCAFCGWGRCS